MDFPMQYGKVRLDRSHECYEDHRCESEKLPIGGIPPEIAMVKVLRFDVNDINHIQTYVQICPNDIR